MPLYWQERRVGDSRVFIAEAPANPGRYRRLAGEVVTVAVAFDGVRIYDQPARPGGASQDEQDLLVAILKKEISLAELNPLFRDEPVARQVLDRFNLLNLESRLLGEDKAWRRIVMPDGGLALGKTLAHSSPKYPYRHLPIAVCIRTNGLYLYRQPLGRQSPPRHEDTFLYIAPPQIEPQILVELFPAMVAAEVTAAYRINRRDLLRVLHRSMEAEPLAVKEGA